MCWDRLIEYEADAPVQHAAIARSEPAGAPVPAEIQDPLPHDAELAVSA
jgi:hypothetical protein